MKKSKQYANFHKQKMRKNKRRIIMNQPNIILKGIKLGDYNTKLFTLGLNYAA